ncbi:hypothetical protein KD5_03270 [Yersinia pseudotuberculosis]|uniref:Uncharacterized protein n=1 Tax=Yersinia similis TaxID=367190 RepID=A0ABM5PVJ2_9GAMM|nr:MULTISPECIES: hypothetical protein [Yersinia pseudotuberculosis complex]AHK18883.1 hypothetical protein BF17_05730 [Yersinia similis]CFQ73908.1 Uncharacterised protein [Yersinia similis]CNC69526.1 Uncharacterised protein [Yersinia similis]CNL65728.1 Uncharacterised protein [Yersinia pseudotuberculosis]
MKVIKFIENNDGFTMDSSAYPDYVNSIKTHVPKNALQFMEASWHYDHRDPKCPHDAKIESLCIRERNFADFRVTDIDILLLGAYGNRMSLFYSEVYSYNIDKKKCEWPTDDYSHGDWLVDEISLSDDGLLIHKIILTDAVISIKSKDVKYNIV